MIDWGVLILQLKGIFVSYANIAKLVHSRNPERLARMAKGEVIEPCYSLGAALIELYTKHVREDLPIVGQPRQARLIK